MWPFSRRPFVPVLRFHGPIGLATPLRPGLTLAAYANAIEKAFSISKLPAVGGLAVPAGPAQGPDRPADSPPGFAPRRPPPLGSPEPGGRDGRELLRFQNLPDRRESRCRGGGDRNRERERAVREGIHIHDSSGPSGGNPPGGGSQPLA